MATTARLNFLDEAADLLAITSPTTSAELRSTRLESVEDVEKFQAAKDGRTCGGCGENLMPGWNCSIKTKKRTRQERLNQDKRMKMITLQCSRCNSFNTLEQARRNSGYSSRQKRPFLPAAESRKVLVQAEGLLPSQRSVTPPSSTNDSGTKKRSRNKKSSLQSLLADRKAAEPKKGPGLDLMDFMKT